MLERLQKVLAQAGVASRRHCEELITKGKIRVNGKVITELGTRVDVLKDKIEVEGKPLPQEQQRVYYLLYKPRGYVTTLKDERGRKTVVELLEGVSQRVYPVGRLDYDSEGLILLTNDGELTQAFTHPSHKIKKTYLARVEGIPEQEKLASMAKGLQLEDGPTSPAEVRLVGIHDNRAQLEIIIHEGRNRQVRRMCEKIGYPVVRLQRTKVGPLDLQGLKPGQFRSLTQNELRSIFTLAGIKPSSREEEIKRANRVATMPVVKKSFDKGKPEGRTGSKGDYKAKRSEGNRFSDKAKPEGRTSATGGYKAKRNDGNKFSDKGKDDNRTGANGGYKSAKTEGQRTFAKPKGPRSSAGSPKPGGGYKSFSKGPASRNNNKTR